MPGATDALPPLVPRGAVAPGERAALALGGVAAVRANLVRLRCTGPGRVSCLQGLVTCDVESPGDGAHRFGALLTPKGMIVTTLWVTRLDDTIHVEAPRIAAGPLRDTFARTLPPRLCRFEDVTATTITIGLYGAKARAVLAGATGGARGLEGAGRAAWLTIAGAAVLAAGVAARGVTGWDLVAPSEAEDAVLAALRACGAEAVGPALLEERRILAGHPRVGAEVDEHTLPQEVRLDELGGVSFEKGCYVGQETVARLHFRGHANRRLMGLALDPAPPSLPCEVQHDERPVGRLTSAAWSERHERYVGLAVLRREVPAGAAVLLDGGASAEVRDLPWETP